MEDILPSVIREASRAVADRLLAPRPRYDNHRDERRPRARSRSRSPARSYTRTTVATIPLDSATDPPPGTGLLVVINLPIGRPQARPITRRLRAAAELRRTALESRRAGWRRTRFPPDAQLAPRDPSGHPLFPSTEAGEDDTDLGPLAGVQEPVHYASRETERRTKAVAEARRGRITPRQTDPLTIHTAGIWATAGPVQTVAQAVNLLRWVYRGDTYATDFMRALVGRAMAHFNATVYGARTPERVNRTNPIPVDSPAATSSAMEEDEPMPIVSDTPLAAAPELPLAPTVHPVGVTTVNADPFDIPFNEEDDDVHDVTVFLGAARRVLPDNTMVHLGEQAAASDAMSRRGTTASISRAVRWYKNMPTSQWPYGMRVSETQWPTMPNAEPLWLDVGAWFTLNALLPRRDLFSSFHRASSLKVIIRVLSVDGMFDHYADTGAYPFNNLPLEHYPFDAGNIEFCHLISWFVQHGIAARSEALGALQTYARSRRNRIANADDPCKTTFETDWPAGPGDVGANMLRAEDLWTEMRHGPVRDGTITLYPRHPGAPIIADITMDNGEPLPQLPPMSPGEETDLQDGPRA
ncbi:hypothetical protein C8R46DRAFT_1229442 [Mycena filopes]|nr:hypothetical protein C8R46DRAFT_1229442 [Mycena filopes]